MSGYKAAKHFRNARQSKDKDIVEIAKGLEELAKSIDAIEGTVRNIANRV